MSLGPRARARWAASYWLLLCLCGCSRCHAAPVATIPDWRPLQNGLSYKSFHQIGAEFHILRVDLNRLTLRVADARKPGRAIATVATLIGEANAVAAVNGTFFDDANAPLGWLVSGGATLNAVHDTSWWAALVISEQSGHPVAEVLPTKAIKALSPERRNAIRFAIQVGPRTVVDGKPIELKNQTASRTAACVTRPDEVLLLVAFGAVASNDLAELMARPVAEGGLGCSSGLMFDGGPSTQLSIRTSAMNLDLPGGWGVPDAVVVVPRR